MAVGAHAALVGCRHVGHPLPLAGRLERPIAEGVNEVHSLELEMANELGLPGLLLTLAYLLMGGDAGHSPLLPLSAGLLALACSPTGKVLGLDAVLGARPEE